LCAILDLRGEQSAGLCHGLQLVLNGKAFECQPWQQISRKLKIDGNGARKRAIGRRASMAGIFGGLGCLSTKELFQI
jgi:hypothetical protein